MKWTYKGVFFFFFLLVFMLKRESMLRVPTTEFKGLQTCSNWSNIRWKRSTKNYYAKKSLVSRTVLTCSSRNLQNKEEDDLTESTSVVSAKYPPKVKLENFYNSRVPKLG